MTRTAATKPADATYEVVMPIIQIQGHVPFGGQHQQYERTLRQGDIVPAWVPATETARLLELGAIGVRR